jgi:hypothetical protein
VRAKDVSPSFIAAWRRVLSAGHCFSEGRIATVGGDLPAPWFDDEVGQATL